MKTLFGILLPFLLIVRTANADPAEDAQRIVELTVTDELFSTLMATMAELMAGNIQNEFAKGDRPMSDEAAKTLAAMLSDEMTSEMVEAMSGPMAEAWLAYHSPETLAAYRTFLETPEGQEIIEQTPAMTTEGELIGKRAGEAVAKPAVTRVIEDITTGEWPEGTLKSVQNELKELIVD